jgi:hypothetical protein
MIKPYMRGNGELVKIEIHFEALPSKDLPRLLIDF